MGRELQKKKNRSSIPKIKLKPKSKRVNPLGNTIIAANWDSKQTLTQNYRRLGLTSRLNAATGGSEVRASQDSTEARLSISKTIPKLLAPTEAHIERDEDGRVVRVHHISGHKKDNPLNDPLNSEDEDDDVCVEDSHGLGGHWSSKNAVIRALEEHAAMVPEKKTRRQSQREKEWIARLVEKHGVDFAVMSRDRKLNPMQQTEADIRRRVEKWRANGGVVA